MKVNRIRQSTTNSINRNKLFNPYKSSLSAPVSISCIRPFMRQTEPSHIKDSDSSEILKLSPTILSLPSRLRLVHCGIRNKNIGKWLGLYVHIHVYIFSNSYCEETRKWRSEVAVVCFHFQLKPFISDTEKGSLGSLEKDAMTLKYKTYFFFIFI